MPEWMWIFLGISFATTIFFAILRQKSIDEKERRFRERYGEEP